MNTLYTRIEGNFMQYFQCTFILILTLHMCSITSELRLLNFEIFWTSDCGCSTWISWSHMHPPCREEMSPYPLRLSSLCAHSLVWSPPSLVSVMSLMFLLPSITLPNALPHAHWCSQSPPSSVFTLAHCSLANRN